MKKLGIIFIILVVLVFAACTKQGTTDNEQQGSDSSQNQVNTNVKEVQGNSVSDSWSNILKLGGKFKCTTTVKDQGQATVYVEKGNYRMEMVTSQDKAFVITKVQPDTSFCTFVWSDKSTEVLKTCMTKEQLDSFKKMGENQGSNSESIKDDQKVDCNPYIGSIDFNTPSGMPVKDYSQMVAGFTNQ